MRHIVFFASLFVALWFTVCCAPRPTHKIEYAPPAPEVAPEFRFYVHQHPFIEPVNAFRESEDEPRFTPMQLWERAYNEIVYVSDPPGEDIWQTTAMTMMLRTGDCEDFSIVLNNAMLAEGYRSYLTVGDTATWHPTEGGHAWVFFYDEGILYYMDATQPPPAELPRFRDSHWLVWKIFVAGE